MTEQAVAADLSVVANFDVGADLVYIPIPEPASWVLLGLGAAGILLPRRQRYRADVFLVHSRKISLLM